MKKTVLLTILLFATASFMHGQTQNQQQWELLGKVDAYYGSLTKSRSHGEDSYSSQSVTGFLYASFNGDRMIYKLFVSVDDKSYDVLVNHSYTGAQVRWSRNGKDIVYLPSLSEMYTHYAGPYQCELGKDEVVIVKFPDISSRHEPRFLPLAGRPSN